MYVSKGRRVKVSGCGLGPERASSAGAGNTRASEKSIKFEFKFMWVLEEVSADIDVGIWRVETREHVNNGQQQRAGPEGSLLIVKFLACHTIQLMLSLPLSLSISFFLSLSLSVIFLCFTCYSFHTLPAYFAFACRLCQSAGEHGAVEWNRAGRSGDNRAAKR